MHIRMKMIRIICFLLLIVSVQAAWAQNEFQDIFNDDTRPFKKNMRFEVSDDLGNEGYLPVTIIKGKTEGPVFTIVAGVHGYEYPPIMGTQEILQEIKAEELRGTLIVIPVASVGSFFTRTPFMNGQDKVNLNNAFPGDAKGSITQKVAHLITENIIPVSDVFLDVHGGDAPEDLLPFVCYYNNEKRPEQTQLAKRLCETSGFQYVVSYPYTISDDEPAKYAFKQAVQDGKTGLSIEAGRFGIVEPEAVALVKMGIYNMLQEMDMYNKGTAPHPDVIKLNNQTYLSSKTEGILYTSYKAGDQVEKGEVVGYSTDLFGEVVEEYIAPVSGTILYMLATPAINVDDTVMCISRNL